MNTPLILIIIDKSGSMSSVSASMNTAMYQLVKDQASERGNADLSLFTFDSYTYHDIKPTNFKQVNYVPIKCNDSTRLYDTIIEAINSVKGYTDVLVMIQTDGQDNKSTTKAEVVKNTIQHKLSQGWQFLYMGAFDDITAEASKIGLQNYAVQFKRDTKGIEQVFTEMSKRASNFRANLDRIILKP